MITVKHRTKSEIKKQSNVWIVGASTGIGRALAMHYAQNNLAEGLIISARSADKLESLKSEIEKHGVRCTVLPMDVSDAESLAQAEVQLNASVEHVSSVIINAGTCEYMDSDNIDTAMARRVFETNYFGALAVSKMALPKLRSARDKGYSASMVFVSSSVTYQALPRAHAYGASKAALRYFAECVKIDLQHESINVQLVSPGFVDTPLTQKNDFEMPFIVSSEDAAGIIVKGINKGTFDIAFPRGFIWALKAISKLPSKLRFALLGKMSRHDAASPADSKGSSRA